MSYCILVVEDEGLIRSTITETLEDAGYRVVEAETGDQACCMLHGNDTIDALLTDIQMPGAKDGIDVAQSFQKHYPNRPVVFMTGRPDMLSRVGKLSPAAALLQKPFRSAQMLDALEVLLARA